VTPRRRSPVACLLLAVLFVLAAAPAVLPQEHAAEAASGSGGSGLAGKIINFVLLFGGLFLLLRKPLAGMLAKRTQDVARNLDEARQARREAEARLTEAKAKVAALESELQRTREKAEEDGRREKDRIRELAGQEAERLRSLAKLEVEAHLKAGVRDLKAYAAELAAQLAEERLKARLTAADQAGLIDKSIAKLKTLHEESDSR
jgi:F-type H+-transporting ATPase subunit b